MKRRFCFTLIGLAAAFFLMSCGDKSVLVLDGETYAAEHQVQPDGDSGTETSAGQSGGQSAAEESTGPVIVVYICGMVNEPGVYEVPENSRVYEIVELAGGFAPGAAESYLNLAEVVTDGQKLVVPALEEVSEDWYGQESTDESSSLVNINTADKELLMSLPGIGEAKALAIIAWRTEHGPFQTTEEIMQVSGIKEAAYEKIKLLITAE